MAERVEAITFNTPLEMRGPRLRETNTSDAVLSILHWRCYRSNSGRLYSEVNFQYSIGDAANKICRCADGLSTNFFQYSIGDAAHLESKYGGLSDTAFNTPLEMRFLAASRRTRCVST